MQLSHDYFRVPRSTPSTRCTLVSGKASINHALRILAVRSVYFVNSSARGNAIGNGGIPRPRPRAHYPLLGVEFPAIFLVRLAWMTIIAGNFFPALLPAVFYYPNETTFPRRYIAASISSPTRCGRRRMLGGVVARASNQESGRRRWKENGFP